MIVRQSRGKRGSWQQTRCCDFKQGRMTINQEIGLKTPLDR